VRPLHDFVGLGVVGDPVPARWRNKAVVADELWDLPGAKREALPDEGGDVKVDDDEAETGVDEVKGRESCDRVWLEVEHKASEEELKKRFRCCIILEEEDAGGRGG